MYVVTVEFEIAPERLAEFLPAVLENARESRRLEPGCEQFDVCTDEFRHGAVFLYEVYADRAAFDAHRTAAHFKRFDQRTRNMVVQKVVRTLERIEQPSSGAPNVTDT